MARTDPIDDEAVHVLHADEPRSGGGGRMPLVLAGIALLVVAVAGAWLWLHPELLAGLGAAAVKAAPAPAPENKLGDAWSFETTESSSASQAWTVPPEAPSGFRFEPGGAVSGELGAVAAPALSAAPLAADGAGGGDTAGAAARAGAAATGAPSGAAARGAAGAGGAEPTPADGAAGWCRIVSEWAIPLGAHRGAVRLSGTSRSPGIALFVRFEAKDRRALDVVLAQGEGRLSGQVLVPPGMASVRAGLQCTGPGSADDLSLEFVAAGDQALARRGIFDVLTLADGAAVFRGEQCVLGITGLSATDPAGALPPASLRAPVAGAATGGEGSDLGLSLPDGRRLPRRASLAQDERSSSFTESVDDVPAGTTLVRTLLVSGPFAEAPLGIVSGRGFEQFSGDFRVGEVRSLVLGHTQDRLALAFEPETTLSATRQSDGSVLVRAELPGGGRVSQTLVSQTSFQEERVAAAQHRDAALAAEGAGRLGEALAEAEVIVTRFPHDEDVLAGAQALRGRVQALMQQRLDVIDRGLQDALFLDSASRCREVLADCNAAASTFAGSAAAERFTERARSVAERASALLEEDRTRRVSRLASVMQSFRAAGAYPHVAQEIQDTLERFLPAPGGAAAGAGAAPGDGAPAGSGAGAGGKAGGTAGSPASGGGAR